jgi:holo-[acyl-carrier protein] synthase
MTLINKIDIGIDVVDGERFKKIPYNKKPSLYKKIFLSSEIEYCLRFKNQHEHFAGKFAIKEAVKKAINESISLLDIETTYNKSKPQVRLRGGLKNKYLFLTSLSHEKNIVVAVVIAETLS